MRKTFLLIILFLLFTMALTFPYQPVQATITETYTFTATSNDGVEFVTSLDYSTAQTANIGNIINTSISSGVGQNLAFSYYQIQRGFIYFDTSTIPNIATITNVKLGLYVYLNSTTDDFNITIQNGQPTYPHSPMVGGDYYYIHYSGDGGSRNTTEIASLGYWNITLNTEGLTYIQKGTETKLCLRSNKDIDAIENTNPEAISYYTAERGYSYSPKLYVTYELGNYPFHYFVHGPFYENGQVANQIISVTLTKTSENQEQFYLNGTDGYSDTVELWTIFQPIGLSWNITSTGNYTRIYSLTSASFEEIWIFVPSPNSPYFFYDFNIADFYGMTNPYMEISNVINGTSRTIERKALTTSPLPFVMQQWQTCELTFRCDQGVYTQAFIANNVYSTNIAILAGAFPTSPYGNELYAYAERLNGSDIQIQYADPSNSTIWLYIEIYHAVGTYKTIDYALNTTGYSYNQLWVMGDSLTDYTVLVKAYVYGQEYDYSFSCPSPTTSTNPWIGLLDSLGSWPPGLEPSQVIAFAIILAFLCIGSYASVDVGCVLAWIVTGILMILGWFTLAIPSFAFAGFVTFLVIFAHAKKTEREL